MSDPLTTLSVADAVGKPAVPIETWQDLVQKLASQIDVVGIIFSGLVIFLAFLIWRWHKDDQNFPDFDITDSLMVNGHVSRDAMIEYGGFIALTFVLIHQEFKDVVADSYVGIYATYCAAKGVAKFFGKAPYTPPETKP